MPPFSILPEATRSVCPFYLLVVPPSDMTLPAEKRPIEGLGLLLVRKTMESVSYRRAHGCNIFTFRRNFT